MAATCAAAAAWAALKASATDLFSLKSIWIAKLEAELGITLFERTARGVAPTKNGEDFLGYARSIIAQMESLETMFGPHTETGTQLSVCAPRASYVAQAFSRYLGAEGRAPLQVQYRETSAAAVISDVASGTANLGVVRWQAEHAATLDNLLRENALSGEVLWEFSMVVLLHERKVRMRAVAVDVGLPPYE